MNNSSSFSQKNSKEAITSSKQLWWVPDDGEVWTLALQISDELPNGCVNFLIQRTQKLTTLPLDKCLSAPSSQLLIPEDLVYIPEVNAASILSCIRSRFIERKIYTNIGMVVMSVNPFEKIPSLYGKTMIDKYENPMLTNLPAHIYTIASRAFHNLCKESNHNQSILISGESGAGKTEATKHCLSFLAEIANKKAIGSSDPIHISGITDRILFASPILEAFGNAKTLRNNNSSRFGKWMVLNFDQYNSLHSSNIVSYLLEKSRVTQRDPKERNYHIFYQLLRGMDSKILAAWNMTPDTRQYRFLQSENEYEAMDLDDRQTFQETYHAFLRVGFTEEETLHYLRIVAAILQLGNVLFSAIRDGEACDIKNIQFVEFAATKLGVNSQILANAMTSRSIESGKGRKSIISIHLNSQKAQETRDTLARSLYDKLFHDIIDCLNCKNKDSSSSASPPRKNIGLLDIFGFEIFVENSFEQLCINYCNEMLQYHFNWIIFTSEKNLYASEGIYCETIEFRDNSDTIKEIEHVFKALDEEARIPRGSSKTWFDKLKRNFKSSCLSFPTRRSGDLFIVKHYAGDVDYNPHEFMDKNIEVLNNDLLNAMVSSKDPLVFRLYTKPGDLSTLSSPSSFKSTNQSRSSLSLASTPSSSSSLNSKSISWRFIHQLNSLMAMLRETQSHFIRCIKSNDSSLPQRFDSSVVFKQLTYSGIFEVVKIQQSGLPCRLPHSEFVSRYRCLAPSKLRFQIKSSKELLKSLQGIGFELQRAKVGTNLTFFASSEQKLLETSRDDLLDKSSVLICRFLRMITRRYAYRVIIQFFREFEIFNSQLDSTPATLAYQQFSLACERLNRLVSYPILEHQIILMKKHLDFLDARVDLIKEASAKLSEKTEEAILSLNDVIAKAIELEITSHPTILSCKSTLQKYNRSLEFMEIVAQTKERQESCGSDEDSSSEAEEEQEETGEFQKQKSMRKMTLNHLTRKQLEECILSLEEFKDLLSEAGEALQLTLAHKQRVEEEILEVYEPLEKNLRLAEILYDETTGDITLRHGDEGAEAYLALQQLVKQFEARDFNGKDCAALYEDCRNFIQLMEDYVASNEASEAMQFIKASSLGKTGNSLFLQQMPEFHKWLDIQMVPHSLREEVLCHHMIPKSDHEEEIAAVSCDGLEKALLKLQELSSPSEDLFAAMSVASQIVELRRAFQEKKWKLLEERIEIASEENLGSHLFDNFPSCYDELHNAHWQVSYQDFLTDLLYSISEPIIQSISFEMESWIVLVSDLEEDLSLMSDVKAFANEESSSRLLRLIPLFEAILQLRSLLYSNEIAFARRVMLSIPQEHQELLKEWDLEEKLRLEFDHGSRLIRKIELEDQLHQLLSVIGFETSEEEGLLLPKSSQTEDLRSLLKEFRDLSHSFTASLNLKLRYCDLLLKGLELLQTKTREAQFWLEASRSFESDLFQLQQETSLASDLFLPLQESLGEVLAFDLAQSAPNASTFFSTVWQESGGQAEEGLRFYLLAMNYQVVMFELFRRFVVDRLDHLLSLPGILVGTVNVDLSINQSLHAESVLLLNEVIDLLQKISASAASSRLYLGYSQLQTLHFPQVLVIELQTETQAKIKLLHRHFLLREMVLREQWQSETATLNPQLLSALLEVRRLLQRSNEKRLLEEVEKIAWECQSRVVVQSLRFELENIQIENIFSSASSTRKISINLRSLTTVMRELESFPAAPATSRPQSMSKRLLQLSRQLVRLIDFLLSNQIDQIQQSDIDKIVEQFEELRLNSKQIHQIFHQIQIHNFLHELNENLLLFKNQHRNLHLLLKSIHQLHKNLLKIIQSQQPSSEDATVSLSPSKPPPSYHQHLWKCLLWLKASYSYCRLSSFLSSSSTANLWVQIIEASNQLDEFLQIYLMPLFYEIVKPRIKSSLHSQRRDSLPSSSSSESGAVLDYTEDLVRFMQLCIEGTKSGFQRALRLKTRLDQKQRQTSLLALSPIDNLKKEIRDFDFSHNRYSIGHLRQAGFSNQEIVQTLAFDAKLLWAYEIDLHLIRRCAASRYSCRDLLSGGFSLKELYNCGYSPKELYQSGLVSIADLLDIGLSIAQLRESGLSEEVLLREIASSSASSSSFRELSGFSLSRLLAMGYKLLDLQSFDFSLLELRGAGFSAQEIHDFHLQRSLLPLSHATSAPRLPDYVKAGFPLKALVSVFPLRDFRQHNYSFEELRRLGVDNDEALAEAGYVKELELEALSLLYQATHGAFWKIKTNWNNYQLPLKQWFGVSTVFDPQTSEERVSSIELINNNLRGFLPVELTNLKKLQKLRLSLNNLSNDIPPKLRQFLLEQQIATDFLKLLSPLPLRSPPVPVPVPDREEDLEAERRALKDLYHLLDGKRWRRKEGWFSEQSSDSWFGIKLDGEGRVCEISLAANNLQGIIPSTISCFKALRILDLRLNQIHGFIPSSLSQCRRLEKLFLQSNKLCGHLPETLKELTKLKILDVRSNLLTGIIPQTFLSLKKLQYLGLHSNRFDEAEVEEIVASISTYCKVVQ